MLEIIAEDDGSHRQHRQGLRNLLETTKGPVRIASAYVTERDLLLGFKNREIQVLTRLLTEQRALFSSDRKAAGELLSVGESKADPALDPIELAAGTVLAEAILNHDEAVLRR